MGTASRVTSLVSKADNGHLLTAAALFAIMRTVVNQHVVGCSLRRFNVRVRSAEMLRRGPSVDAHAPALEGDAITRKVTAGSMACRRRHSVTCFPMAKRNYSEAFNTQNNCSVSELMMPCIDLLASIMQQIDIIH